MEPIYQKVAIGERSSFFVKDTFSTLFHYHSEFEIIYFYAGSGKCIIGDYFGTYREGDLFFIGEQLAHCFMDDNLQQDNRVSKSIVIQWDSRQLKELLLLFPEMNILSPLLELSSRGAKYKTEHFSPGFSRMILELKNETGFERLRTMFGIIHGLSNSKEFIPLASEGFSTKVKPYHLQRINKVYTYVENNFRSKISLEEISSLLHMNPATFCRYFRKINQRTFLAYLNEYRVSQVCKQLLQTDQKISEIGFDNGFDSIPNFNKQFKSVTGFSPKEYRKKYLPAYSLESNKSINEYVI